MPKGQSSSSLQSGLELERPRPAQRGRDRLAGLAGFLTATFDAAFLPSVAIGFARFLLGIALLDSVAIFGFLGFLGFFSS